MPNKRDEKIKLTANLLNAAAGSSFTVGAIGPIVAVSINLSEAAARIPTSTLALNVGFWSCAGAVLHIIARKMLEGLSE